MHLLRVGNKLARLDGRLITDEGGAPCCCGPGFAVKFVECCDADPTLWIAAEIVDGCEGVTVGELCYRSTGQVATIADLARAGVEVLRQFTPGDGCTAGCTDPRCRACPVECCITAYLGGCLTTDPRRCCLLGSAYKLTYERVVEYRRTGPLSRGLTIIDGGVTRCVPGYDPGVVREFTETTSAVMWHTGTLNTGESCSGIQPSAHQTFRRTGRQFAADSIRYDTDQARWIVTNPRYVEIDEFTQSDAPLFARGELPTILYLETDARTPDGFPIGNGCDFRRRVEVCAVQNPNEPCPGPNNPIDTIYERAISGTFDCSGGTQTLTEYVTEFACAGQPNEVPMPSVRTTRHTWTVEILSRVGCEVQSCDDIGPDPNGGGSGLIAGGGAGSGCAGCRQEPGL